MSPQKTPRGSTSKVGGLRHAGIRSERVQIAYNAAKAKVKENWGVSNFMDIFPAAIRPEQELGFSAIYNLKNVSQLENDLKRAQLLMLEHCVDPSGTSVKISFKHTDQILKALKSGKAHSSTTKNGTPLKKENGTPLKKEKKRPAAIDIAKAKNYREGNFPEINRSSAEKRGLEPDEDSPSQVGKKTRVAIPSPDLPEINHSSAEKRGLEPDEDSPSQVGKKARVAIPSPDPLEINRSSAKKRGLEPDEDSPSQVGKKTRVAIPSPDLPEINLFSTKKRGLEPGEDSPSQVGKKTRVAIPSLIESQSMIAQNPDCSRCSPILPNSPRFEEMGQEIEFGTEQKEMEMGIEDGDEELPISPESSTLSSVQGYSYMLKDTPDSPPPSPLTSSPVVEQSPMERLSPASHIRFDSPRGLHTKALVSADEGSTTTKLSPNASGSSSPTASKGYQTEELPQDSPSSPSLSGYPIPHTNEALPNSPSRDPFISCDSSPTASKGYQTEELPQDSPPSPSLSGYPIPHTNEALPNSPSRDPFISCDSPATPILSEEGKMPAFEDMSIFVSAKEHRRLCDELFARISGWQKVLDDGELRK